jgi:hypothetical protein
MQCKAGWAVLLLFSIAGCKQGSNESTIVTQATGSGGDVQLIVSATPDPEGGLLITATVKNMGQDTFRYTATCGRADMEFRFTDAEGKDLTVTNPCEPQPMMGCPTALGVILAPDGMATAQHWWSGKLWSDCTGTEAPAGDYRVTVTFTFYQDIEIGRQDVEATGTFHWQP